MKINLNNTQINTLQNKNRLYSYLSNTMDSTFFRIGNGKFTFCMNGDGGTIETSVDVDCNEEETSFRFDYSKWQTVLQKFSCYNTVTLSTDDKHFIISTPESSDTAIYTIYENENAESYINTMYSNHNDSVNFEVTDEIVSDFDLMNNMFSIQSTGNSIGMKKDSVIYADGTVVLKTLLSERVSDDFFSKTSEDNVFFASNLIKVISMLYKNNREFTFFNDYKNIYWHDDDTELVFCSDLQVSELPTDEDFESFKPSNGVETFTLSAKTFKDTINFFNGVYEGSEWKPLKFNFDKDTGLTVSYETDLTNLKKHIDGVTCNKNTSFILSSDTLKYIVFKIYDRFTGDAEISVTYSDSSDDIGVYMESSGVYQVVLVKLEDF